MRDPRKRPQTSTVPEELTAPLDRLRWLASALRELPNLPCGGYRDALEKDYEYQLSVPAFRPLYVVEQELEQARLVLLKSERDLLSHEETIRDLQTDVADLMETREVVKLPWVSRLMWLSMGLIIGFTLSQFMLLN